MEQDAATRVTQILQHFGEREHAADDLLPLVYDQLRAIATRRMAGERAAHTLQATALVHEAYVKLIGDQDISWENRAHFFGAAAEAMRRILIDHARKRSSQKRGGGRSAVPMSVVDLAEDCDPSQVLALDEALTNLEASDPRAAKVVQLRFFAGLGVDEVAEVLGISERTVMREWAFARAQLFESLGDGGAPSGEDAP